MHRIAARYEHHVSEVARGQRRGIAHIVAKPGGPLPATGPGWLAGDHIVKHPDIVRGRRGRRTTSFSSQGEDIVPHLRAINHQGGVVLEYVVDKPDSAIGDGAAINLEPGVLYGSVSIGTQ